MYFEMMICVIVVFNLDIDIVVHDEHVEEAN